MEKSTSNSTLSRVGGRWLFAIALSAATIIILSVFFMFTGDRLKVLAPQHWRFGSEPLVANLDLEHGQGVILYYGHRIVIGCIEIISYYHTPVCEATTSSLCENEDFRNEKYVVSVWGNGD